MVRRNGCCLGQQERKSAGVFSTDQKFWSFTILTENNLQGLKKKKKVFFQDPISIFYGGLLQLHILN